MTNNEITREKTFSEELPYFKEQMKEVFDYYDNPKGCSEMLYISALNDSNRIVRKAEEEITRQQEEIERLNKEIQITKDAYIMLQTKIEIIKSEAIKEFAEKIYTEINEALAQNHKVKVERINKLIARGIKSNDEFCYEIDGKILALRGISEFIDNFVKEMVG